VAPFYGFFGFGMALYFASQGAGRVLWPVIAGVTRLVVATGGGWYWVVVHHGSLAGLFWFAAASLCLFGVVNATAFVTGVAWGGRSDPGKIINSLLPRRFPAIRGTSAARASHANP
jgi:Na+-driven multidrug efflux pump